MIADVLFWVAASPIALFAILYGVAAPWWRTAIGRYQMALAVVLVLVAMLGAFNRLFGFNYPGDVLVRSLVFTITGFVMWWRLVMLVRVQVIHRWKERKDE